MKVETKHKKLRDNWYTYKFSYVKIWHGDAIVSLKIALRHVFQQWTRLKVLCSSQTDVLSHGVLRQWLYAEKSS